MRYVIKKSENPYKGLKLKECSNLSGEMSDCQTSEKTDDMSKDDRSNEMITGVCDIDGVLQIMTIPVTDTSHEIWVKAFYNDVEYPDYEVSNLGRVRSFKGKNVRILKAFDNSYGYLKFNLYKDKKQIRCFAHRLVLSSFKSLPENFEKLQIDHVNTDRTDNRICNLQWVSREQNMQNPLTKQKFKTKTTKAKEVQQFSFDGKLIKTYKSMSEAAKKLNICTRSISYCCNGNIKSTGGYIWRFKPALED